MTSQDLYKSALNRRTQIRRDYPEKDMMPEEIKLEFDSVQNAITDYERKSSKESNSSTEYVQPQDMTKEDNGFSYLLRDKIGADENIVNELKSLLICEVL